MKYPKVGDIVSIMEQWAPAWLAEPWDNVGLMTGSKNARVEEAWISLDCTPALLKQAMSSSTDKMLLFHHPPIFKPLKNLLSEKPAQATLLKAAASGLNLFAAHTNLDAAADGVNQALADAFGLRDSQALEPAQHNPWLKIVVFVPQSHTQALKKAMFAAGAGEYGNYRQCAFSHNGQGQFTPMDNANPVVGRRNQPTMVEESRVEMMVGKDALSQVLRALYQHHPYEEPAFDIIPLLNTPRNLGLGRVGNLAQPLNGRDFLFMAGKVLKAGGLQYTGPLPRQVSRVAVLGGSGAGGLAAAKAAGAQVFITGEAGYHAAEQARDMEICLLVMGHYPTEAVIVKPWAAKLEKQLRQAGFACLVKAPVSRDPWKWLAFGPAFIGSGEKP